MKKTTQFDSNEMGAFEAEAKVYGFACPLLEPLVEEGWHNKPEARMMIKKYLHPLKVRQIDTLILGSTHYTVLKRIIQQKIGKRVRIIDSPEAVIWKLVGFLKAHPEIEERLPKKGTVRFYASDITDGAKNLAKRLFGRNLRLEPVKPGCKSQPLVEEVCA